MKNDLKAKILRCPVCGARLIDAAKNITSKLRPEEDVQTGWQPDYYQKCYKCKKLIGIRKVS